MISRVRDAGSQWVVLCPFACTLPVCAPGLASGEEQRVVQAGAPGGGDAESVTIGEDEEDEQAIREQFLGENGEEPVRGY